MTNPHGSWIWYELMTPDAQASRAFYEGVVGWKIDAESAMPGMEYRMIHAADGQAGGVMTLDADMLAGGARPCWLGYVGVDDVDTTVEQLKAAGGSVHLPPQDIPDVGRFAMVADPQGVPFYVMRGASDEDSNAYGRMATGHVSWNELQTSDDAASFTFYNGLFGWEKAGGMPMPWGEYAFLRNKGAGDAMDAVWGAMMPREKPEHPVGWTFYFRVPDIEAAHARVKELGGTPLSDPMEVPGGERVFHATDPHGAVFGLVAPK
ncbi:VOC family protein [Sphingomonas sp. MG17]|uniref:VOC family protein n=1 Tax=Sphingomonas tagetis TaxID=2949092 RepID=A0A9X2KPB7_9SPHN|nr:VOC family protein [Sphingomonas tagetis]MCP3730528.1 VOC family protein [Sphingomonas tagetis]